jgi:Rhodopirellula transposase DDE domain
MSMCMTFFLWLMAKRSPLGSTTSFTTVGLGVLGIDHDTAEFAVESIRRWWHTCGKALYPGKKELLLTADGGGSNGVKNRLWKKKLQDFATEEHLTMTVAHYPPATSKWNKIEHRLFAFISIGLASQAPHLP